MYHLTDEVCYVVLEENLWQVPYQHLLVDVLEMLKYVIYDAAEVGWLEDVCCIDGCRGSRG